MLIKKIGFHTKSSEIRMIKNCVFWLQFFSSGLMVLVMSANFDFTKLAFNGQYSDFNKGWFQDVGSVIVKGMVGACWWPPFDVSMKAFLLYLKRVKDQGTLLIERVPSKTK